MGVAVDSLPQKTKILKGGTSYAWASYATKKPSLGYGIGKTSLKYVKLYCKHSALVGYKYLTEPGRTWIERIIWITVHISVICMLGYFVNSAYHAFTTVPMVTSVESDHYPTNSISFPGIDQKVSDRTSRI